MNDTMVEGVARDRAGRRKPRTWLRLTLVLLALGLMAAGLVGFHWYKAGALKQVSAAIQSQQPTVGTATASLQPWQATLTAVGSLTASEGADLQLETSGVIEEVPFESGRDVTAGTLLLRLRPDNNDALLLQLQATADLDEITYRRDLKQLRLQGVAQATVDTDAGTLKAARAQVVAQQALNLEKTVRAPFAGRLGIRQINLGQYIAAGTTIVTLQALDPMFIDFYLPQQAIGQIAVGQAVEVTVDAYSGRTFPGTVSSLNSHVDSASRMLEVRATVPNPDRALLPGMFATAVAANGPARPLITVPGTAIAYNPYGSLVFVVHDGKDGKGRPQKIVRQQFVTTGAQRGDQVSVIKGLAAGDIVVTAGQLKLSNGGAVKIDNSVKVTDDPAPAPQDH